MKEGTINS